MQVVANVIAIFFIDRVGRKVLLIASNIFICASIVILGLYFYFLEVSVNGTELWHTVSSLYFVPLTCFVVYCFAFNMGNGPIPFMMNGEIFATEAKRLCSTISICFIWLCAFVVTQIEYYLEKAIGLHGACFLYGAITAVSIVGLFFIPETKGKSSEELAQMFAGGERDEKSN